MRVQRLIGAVLVLIGIGTALWQLWPDISYRAGLVRETYPYESAFSTDVQGPVPSGRRVVIPDIAVDVEIFQGDEAEALRRGVYHHEQTAAPGEPGNIAIAGHRNRDRFALLYALEQGDEVIVYWDGAEYDYRVRETFTVEPDDETVLVREGEDRLTLYTCRPRFLGDTRTVVVAEPVAR